MVFISLEIQLRTFAIPVLFHPKKISAPAQILRDHRNGQLMKHLYCHLAVSEIRVLNIVVLECMQFFWNIFC